MSGVYAAIAAGTAAVGYLGSQSASNKQISAEESAMDAQQQMFNQQQANQGPYLQAGSNALSQIQQNMPNWNRPFTMQDFQSNLNPEYQWQLGQGQEALRQASGATGKVGAGELAALNNYTQNFANTGYQQAFENYQNQITNQYNRLASVAQLGQTGTQNANQGAMNAGNQIGQSAVGIGNAQAAGQVGSINAISGAVGQGLNAYNTNQILDKVGNQNNPQYLTSLGGTGGEVNGAVPGMSGMAVSNNGSVSMLGSLGN